MRKLFKICIAAFLICLSCATMCAKGFANGSSKFEPETLRYKVMFKWGLINKQAGSAVLTLNHDSKHYHARLAAASEPWADKIYRVRDTLNGCMRYVDFAPLYYEKIAHEGGEHKHDVVNYNYSMPGKVAAECSRKVYKKGELKIDERRSMESEGKAVDMLTSFYYMRQLPFDSWHKGEVETLDIFSGKRKELLSIEYLGKENVTVGDTSVPSHHIRFTFTVKGGAKTSDDMEAWISTDKARVPLRLEGKLPVGKVHCVLVDR